MSDFADRLIAWYEENKRALPWRETTDPYAIWVSEIMLQQTRVEAVKPYYARFLEELPDVLALADADAEKLNKLWQGLGYYSRARNMQKAAKTCVIQYGGKLPRRAEELRKLCGIGEYTAAAIASFAFGEPVPAIDGNVRRLITRYLALEEPIGTSASEEKIVSFLREQIPQKTAAAFNQATIELGATLCGPDRSARCGGCPLLRNCAAFAEGKTEELPRRQPKSAKKVEEKTVLVLVFRGATALYKRPEKGLLAGLWAPPALDGHANEREVRAFLAAHGCAAERISSLPAARHIFTHIIWEMRGYKVELNDGGDFSFYARAEREKLALPSAYRAYTGFFE